MGLGIRNIQVVFRIECNRPGIGQVDFQRRAVTIKAGLSGTHDRRDNIGLVIDFANAVASGITNIQIVLGINRHAQRQVQPGFPTRTVIPAVTGLSNTRIVMKGPGFQIDPTNPVRPVFGNVEPTAFLVDTNVIR